MIVQLEEARLKLVALRSTVRELGISLRVDELREQATELEKQTTDPNFWSDQANSSSVLQGIKQKKDKVEEFERLAAATEEAHMMCEMSIEEEDESSTEDILAEVMRIEREVERMNIEVLLSGEYDRNNAILSFHPGAGGTEAQDWALMLYRMYTRWGEKNGFRVKLIDWLDGEEAGIKSATIMIEGTFAYGYMKGESGVHRLVRVSPFDSSGRRHTSFASVEVTPELDDSSDVEIREEDIEVTAHRSSGAGGQHINKTDSAIRIVHKPTGIVVGCQTERSQLQNKETAMKMLKSKLVEIKIREHLDKIEDIKGEKNNIEWGSQIRSYVFMPYTLVKDARTGCENGNIQAVMDGELEPFINAYLRGDVIKK